MRHRWLVALALVAHAPAAWAQTFTVAGPPAEAEVSVDRPVIVYEFAAGSISATDRARLRFLLDDVDITEFAVWTTERVTVRAPLAVPDGEHTAAILAAGSSDAATLVTVMFRTVPPRRQSTVDARLSDSSTLELDRQKDDILTIAPHADGTVSSAWGTTRYDVTWTQPVDLQGMGSQALLAPDFVVQHDRGRWQSAAGVTEAEALVETQFLGLRTHRRMIETTYDRPAFGRIQAYSNLADAVPGSGGQRSFQQWIQGVAWRPDLRSQRVSLTLLAETVRDRNGRDRTAASFSLAERATLVGAVARITLSRNWTAVSELAASRVESGGETTAGRNVARALRFNLVGSVAGNAIEARVASVGSDFGNPGDPGLKSDRREAEVDLSRRARRWNYRVRASFATDGLDRATRASEETRYRASLGVRLPSDVRASIEVDRQEVTGDRRDRAQSKMEIRLTRSRSGLRLDLRLGFTETDDRLRDRTTMVKMARGAIAYSAVDWWSLSAGGGIESRAVGRSETQVRSVFIEPVWRLGGPGLQATLRLAYDARRTLGRSDVRNLSGRGGLSWTLPGAWRVATLAVDGGWDREDDLLFDIVRVNRTAAVKLVFAPEWIHGRRL